jgi:glycerol-3-phosphate dehydrogenase
MLMRSKALESLQGEFDVLIIGGGATGLGIAVDAATRGYRIALVEAGDFAQATSSRATKLVHGGVRYLASGQIHLVYEALHERAVMLRNAPHLVQSLAFVLPAYKWIDLPFYGIGLKIYDLLSGKSSMGPTHILGRKQTQQRLPNINGANLSGSILYHDGQFDDARLALALARTAEDHGAVVLNYVRSKSFLKEAGRIVGAVVEDIETGAETTVRAKVVINATGIFVDDLRKEDNPSIPKLLSVSRGTHIVVAASVLAGETAIMVPKTEDGRVIFAIPWSGRVVIGTTDIAATDVEMEPGHQESEIEYLMQHINPYLASPIQRSDILSIFSGLRPLVTGKSATTSKLSREHHIDVSPTGLITIAGGKWTTYRRMAEDALNFAISHQMLPKQPCRTREIRIHGAPIPGAPAAGPLSRYGSDAEEISLLMAADPALTATVDTELPFRIAEVVYAVRHEMARTVEDVLSRRMRALLIDAKAAWRAAPVVASVMAKELGRSPEWEQQQIAAFQKLATEFYLP